jgi:hypothetical protein
MNMDILPKISKKCGSRARTSRKRGSMASSKEKESQWKN